MKRRIGILLLLPLVAGCGKLRGAPATDPCPTWVDVIGPALQENCTTCHRGPTPAADYDLTTYRGTLASGADAEPNVVPGVAASVLAEVLTSTEAPHRGFDALRLSIVRWSGTCGAAYTTRRVHEPGVLVRGEESDAFHGALWRKHRYRADACGRCHQGVTDVVEHPALAKSSRGSAPSCGDCHIDSPTSCDTCHAEVVSGAHSQHLDENAVHRTFGCDECHVEPATLYTPGHVLAANGQLDEAPAEVRFGPIAALTLTPESRARVGEPAYDPMSSTCAAVYCHGATLEDSLALAPTPVWTEVRPVEDCVGCHGMPPQTHGAGAGIADCGVCHVGVLNEAGGIGSPRSHIDGRLSLRAGIDSCDGCHGSGPQGGPPPSLSGATSFTDPGVGAHDAHANPRRGLRGAMECAECHVVPADVRDAAHIDGDGIAEVFEGAFAGIAAADGAQPAYTRETGSCAGVYCHGAGAAHAADAAAGMLNEPRWTAVYDAEVFCGSCHGVPPINESHAETMTISDCAECHAASIDTAGRFRFESGADGAPSSRHINGVIDAN